MAQISDEFRKHYEAVSGAVSDIGNALGLLGMIIEANEPALPEPVQGRLNYLYFQLVSHQQEAERRLPLLWAAPKEEA
ncbi:hypothetical protein [Teichococcus vastitatis]|uniref:hypothetical protein n=1 Tax=Teichococcus vastitatis TaxID=2307076 RepID=UPI000E7241A9|nr:hypothetical protein [Pseudoroseomonas vastitatis]